MVDGINLGNIMVDCDDEQKLCEFYHKLLGWEKSKMFGGPALRNKNGIVFLFIEEKDYIPPIWPEEEGKQQKQMHFDFQVPDVAAAVEYAKSLGAEKATFQFGGSEWITMIDPAGHPFCLCAQENET
ncbi:MAG: VOC family protein [Clostridium sp.]|jgi:predicted enzyme related to lactoylglutathione lyase|uniref:VOC family protein n=1 Tax=Clostridium sp. TaxID=1506 RepID=UPI0025C122E0|nr:VOC family protein [Clostridium sp.]MCH3963416.1 VOC family protein [Clostridium sp.]MCI1716716.1 VOC family protein [Clostridium sp.]MCI1801100.1 VOC family protein [Clostridium sp.]MCI1814902.1 VOC family protein [Clostridium sp.]MCI1871803.1 VOC family protein [Clostridium sp.]